MDVGKEGRGVDGVDGAAVGQASKQSSLLSLGRHQGEAVEEAVKGGVAPACYEQGTRTPDGEGSAAEGTDGRSGGYGTRQPAGGAGWGGGGAC